MLSSLQRSLDRITIEEFADMSTRNSPELIFDLMGFGADPAAFDASLREQYGGGSFAGSLAMVADAVSLPLDEVVATAQVAVANEDIEVAAGRLAAGTVGAQRLEVAGLRQGRPLLTFCAHWYLTDQITPAWELHPTGWRVQVHGDTPLDVQIRFPVPDDEWAATSPGLTADRPVNAVRYVCAAEPGIRTSAELPQIIPNLSRRDPT